MMMRMMLLCGLFVFLTIGLLVCSNCSFIPDVSRRYAACFLEIPSKSVDLPMVEQVTACDKESATTIGGLLLECVLPAFKCLSQL